MGDVGLYFGVVRGHGRPLLAVEEVVPTSRARCTVLRFVSRLGVATRRQFTRQQSATALSADRSIHYISGVDNGK